MAKAKTGQTKLSAHWQSRIVGHSRVDPRKLKDNPNNWRLHPETQAQAMRDSLDRLGVLQPIVVNKRSGRIVDGHLRRQLALDNNEEHVDVIYVDLSEDEENLALAIMNPMGELAATDPEKLGALLANVDRGDSSPLDRLLGQLEEQASGASVKQAATSSDKGKRATNMTQTAVMRMMLENPNVAIVERALASTGLMNRGDALVTICKHYLGKENAEGQHNSANEGSAADQLAQALASAAGGTRNPRRTRPSVGSRVPEPEAGSGVRAGSTEGGDPDPPAADVERVSGEGGTGAE